MLTATHWGCYEATVENGELTRMTPFTDDPDPSPIGQSLIGAAGHPVRIRRPAVRRGWLEKGPGKTSDRRGQDEFVEIDWTQALDLLANELTRIRDKFGNEAIFGGSYGWASAGRFHHAQSHLKRFLNMFGGYTGSVNSYSFGAGQVVLPHILGPAHGNSYANFSSWDSIAGHSQMIVMFGGAPTKNSQVEAGGVGRHMTRTWMRRCHANGATFVNISPAQTDLAGELEAEWLPLRPNSDVALMLGLAHTLVNEGLHNRDFLATHTHGYERFETYLLGRSDQVPKDATWASRLCDLSADTIRILARRMASHRTLITVNWSLQRARHGEQPLWMAITLAAMLGQIGLPGGGFGFGYGAVGTIGNPGGRFNGPAVEQGNNPVKTYIPVSRIVDLLSNPNGTLDFNGMKLRLPDIRMIYWAGGNPFHHHQDINRLLTAWRRPETIVVNEQHWNSLARHADIVLPATLTIERNDLGVSSRDRHLFASRQVLPPHAEARNDFDIFTGLASRLGFADAYTEGRDEMAWLRHLYQGYARNYQWLPTFEEFWEAGSIELQEGVQPPIILLQDFRKDPRKNPLATPSGKIEIFSETIEQFGYADCPPHPTWLEHDEWLGGGLAQAYPLHLLSNQPAGRLHSQLDFGAASEKMGGREPVRLHPLDAAARGISDGDVVRLFNQRGSCLAVAVLSENLRQGVVQISTGAWYDPANPGVIGSLDRHGNPNVLTSDIGTSRLGQGANANSCLIEIERYTGAVPEVRIFEAPALARIV